MRIREKQDLAKGRLNMLLVGNEQAGQLAATSIPGGSSLSSSISLGSASWTEDEDNLLSRQTSCSELLQAEFDFHSNRGTVKRISSMVETRLSPDGGATKPDVAEEITVELLSQHDPFQKAMKKRFSDQLVGALPSPSIPAILSLPSPSLNSLSSNVFPAVPNTPTPGVFSPTPTSQPLPSTVPGS
eukprot:gene16137-684_t